MKILFLLLFSTLGVFSPATARAFWFEPYAGYELSHEGSGLVTYAANGPSFGVRLGAESASIFYGIEYALAYLDTDRPKTVNDIEIRDIGLVIGNQFSMVRAWLTYWLSNNANWGSNAYSGMGGYKLGLGVKVFTQAYINVEKSLRIWQDSNGRTLSRSHEIDGLLISLSLPFTF